MANQHPDVVAARIAAAHRKAMAQAERHDHRRHGELYAVNPREGVPFGATAKIRKSTKLRWPDRTKA